MFSLFHKKLLRNIQKKIQLNESSTCPRPCETTGGRMLEISEADFEALVEKRRRRISIPKSDLLPDEVLDIREHLRLMLEKHGYSIITLVSKKHRHSGAEESSGGEPEKPFNLPAKKKRGRKTPISEQLQWSLGEKV